VNDSPSPEKRSDDAVGPVLLAGETTKAIVQAIRELNRRVSVQDRGSYVRVLVPKRCRLTREAIERVAGRPFRLPGDLEEVMPSFRGRLTMSDDEAVWEWKAGA
jgi:toluene monooxygenase system protein D